MIRRIDLAVVDDSNIVEMCKQYGDKYVVEPNVEAIKRWRSCYHSLSGSRRNIEKLRRLSDEVLLHFEANRQTNADCEIKMALMDELRKVIQNRARWNFKLLPFGSTMTGLATKQSDLDLIIWCPEANTFFSNEAE
ncbi:unnamed protein product [Angiostrongylus costaricensis]|uniref:NTP_transf_2 domain-containing protein n=1 Tax=Angiostrongylus costaricensis TaxID=334426 RepID=A0A0R3PXN4_ANGCS|nr:unnamed protein product [Angiostrongylus costaricensis]